jgi:hypothetical protein
MEMERVGKSEWNTAAMRDLLTAAFDDEELTTLCFDHFLPVYEDLSSGMSKGQKVQRLLDHCTRHDQLGTLVRLVEERNPAQYARFAPSLSRGQAATTPVSPPPARSGSVNYERGLEILKARLERTGRYDEFNVLEARLRENLRDERTYGASEQSRRERAQVIDALNRLALDVLGTSFNDLSRG